MAAVVFLTHMPLLRLAEDEVPFAYGELTCLPWEQYDLLSQGAFSDFQRLYEQTAPVFYRVDVPDLDVPPVSTNPSTGGMMEFSGPSAKWGELLPAVGLGLLLFHSENLVDPSWTALLLAAPAAAPAWPRLSVTFAVRGDESASFEFQGQNFDAVRVDGDAGQQLLFSPRTAGTAITAATVERASGLLPLLEQAETHPELAAALASLRAIAHPSLSPAEQTTLAVVTLEALLLPEVTTGLAETFARRVVTLLGPDDESASLKRLALALYDARSTSLHGRADHLDETAADTPFALRLLAGAIEALARAVAGGEEVAAVCAGLDEAREPATGHAPHPQDLEGLEAADRLSARTPKEAAGFSLGGPGESMEAQEGTRLSWSPLVGLACEGSLDFGQESGVFLISATPASVLTLEDKDVRRELGNLLMTETSVACLGVVRELSDDAEGQVEEMLRTRDLAVVALRLAGFRGFADPELLGSYVYDGGTRTIDTSVVAPMVLRAMGADPEESFGEGDVARLSPDWSLVSEYDATARHGEIDHVLTLFRRAHDDTFLPSDARAGLLLSALEAMLGRFRPRNDPVKLEKLVHASAAGDPAAAWFEKHGREFRNAVAHGYWDRDPAPLMAMQTLLRPIVRAYLQAWLAADDHQRRPGRVFQDASGALR